MKRKRFLSVLLALTMVLSMTLTFAGAASNIEITDITQLEPYFTDVNFRTAVFAAVKNGQDNATGANVEEALKNFTGNINAKGLGITNAYGLQFLRHADEIDLSKNKISDFDFLWAYIAPTLNPDGSVNDAVGPYFGTKGDGTNAATNVTWKLGGNPFTKLPYTFGGNLVIEQPATTASIYAEDGFRPRVYLRGQEPDSQVFNITRCEVFDAGGIDSKHWARPVPGSTPNLLKPQILAVDVAKESEAYYDGIRLYFSDVKKSGIQSIGIGLDEEVKYVTSDEWSTETPGSQSFKYYINPHFFIYDKVTVGYEDSITLKKVDEQGNPLSGAEYAFREKGNDAVLGNYTTDDDGLIVITENLGLSTYTLTETKAPEGYIKDSEPMEFTIQSATAQVTLGGGSKSILTTTDLDADKTSSTVLPSIQDDQTFSEQNGITYIAGPQKDENRNDLSIGKPGNAFYKAVASPDITLTENSGDDTGFTVHVIYSALEITGGDGTITEKKVSRVFDTLAAAAADVNREKNDNHIVGSVAINVSRAGVNAGHKEHVNKKIPPYDPGPSTPTVSVKGEKIWVDDNNSGNTRPTSIKVELYRDGGDSPYRTATVSASNNWKYSFTGLAKHRTGNTPYTYTVKEADVPEGYTSAVDNAAGSTGSTVTTTITNTLTPPEKPPVTPEEPKEPGDPGDPQTPGEPPVTPPTDPGEPPVTPPGDPGVPPTTPPTTPPATPSTNPNLPQTGTVRDSAPALLCLALATALAGCAVILRSKRKNCD